LSGAIVHFWKDEETNEWKAEEAARLPAKEVENWTLPEIPALISDILLSMDDKYLYASAWLQGFISQYDISDPFHIKLVDKLQIGGALRDKVKYTGGEEQPPIPEVKGLVSEAGPQMIQLSLDGKRLYVTDSLYTPWDRQFYPDLISKGSKMFLVDVDNVNGGMTLNKDFLVDFGKEPWGPVMTHEVYGLSTLKGEQRLMCCYCP